MSPRTPTPAEFAESFRYLEIMWRSPKLPLDCRRIFCGAVQAAGRRQEEETAVFDERIMEKIAAGEPVHPEESQEMFEKVHEFVFIKHRLRDQYMILCLKTLTNCLNRQAAYLAKQFEEELERKSSQN